MSTVEQTVSTAMEKPELSEKEVIFRTSKLGRVCKTLWLAKYGTALDHESVAVILSEMGLLFYAAVKRSDTSKRSA